jgi:hypothetical protein
MEEMMITSRRVRTPFTLLLTAMMLASAACSLPVFGEVELPDDGPPVPVSGAAAASFFSKALASSESAATSQKVRFTVTQEEATSALAIGAQLAALSPGGPAFDGLDSLQGIPGADFDQLLQAHGDSLPDGLPPELTGLLGGADVDGGPSSGLGLPDLRLKLEEPQVYFKNDGRLILRGYGRLWRWRQPIRVVVAPAANGDSLDLDFVEGQLGPLPLPEFLFDPVGKLLAKVLLAGRDYAEISELTVGNGTMTFAGSLHLSELPTP